MFSLTDRIYTVDENSFTEHTVLLFSGDEKKEKRNKRRSGRRNDPLPIEHVGGCHPGAHVQVPLTLSHGSPQLGAHSSVQFWPHVPLRHSVQDMRRVMIHRSQIMLTKTVNSTSKSVQMLCFHP